MAPDPRVGFASCCLILDFDGTVLDTEGSLYRSWAELWEAHGEHLDLGDWQQTIGTEDSFDPWTELETRVGRTLDPDLGHHRRQRRDEIQSLLGPRPGVMDWLAEAAELGLPVGIASSSSAEWVEGHLERIGIRPRFAAVVCRSEAVPAKPDPTSYRLACARLGADSARSLAVEDSPHGVAAAVAAGLYTVAVPHPLTRDLDLSGADLVLDSLEALPLAEALERAGRRSPSGPGAPGPGAVSRSTPGCC
jgi:HAD superfamily hydrolase (TIGR01509 family)